jgi:riboflavin kinase/FMN adenylyltransferase
VTIGNFDGVHLGHQRIMRQLSALSRENNWRPVVLTFEPHPLRVLAPAHAPKLLTTLEERCRLMHEQGIEDVVILPFTHEIARCTPEQFVEGVIAHKLHARAIIVGENFRFGHKAAGDIHLLRQLGKQYGFSVQAAGVVTVRNRVVSSTEVRKLIYAGEVSLACRLLGRPYALEGQVVRGHGVGSKQTVPTLNLQTSAEILPEVGVYITRTHDQDSLREWPSISNVGYRPTFDGDRLSIETFLLAPFNDRAPSEIRVEFLRRVRDERKFESPEALRAQIMRDVGRAQAYFRRLREPAIRKI